MSRVNPLLLESWRGLADPVEATRQHAGYLLLQSAALLLWWPWGEMRNVLETGSEPRALLAVVIALGVSAALYGVRTGAEEVMLPGQHPLREWLVGTPLGVVRILSGYLAAHLLQTLYLLVLSAPLLMLAVTVATADWSTLAWALLTVVVLGTCCRLLGALIYLLIGHRSQASFVILRGLVLFAYAVAPFTLPEASQPMLSYALLIEGHTMRLAVGAWPGHLVFLAVYGGLCGLLTIALCWLSSIYRRDAAESTRARARSAPGGSS